MTPFDWQRVLLDDFPLLFLAEVALRASFAFATVFLFLKISDPLRLAASASR